jgi:hypothetical protein
MRRQTIGTLLILLSMAAVAGAAGPARPNKPRLDLRASPRVAFSPVVVLLTAELVGGDEAEEFYCPSLQWEWGDGGRSSHESDCPPYQAGSQLERRYTAEHGFRQAGDYNVKVTMRRGGRVLATASARIALRPGLGDIRAGE